MQYYKTIWKNNFILAVFYTIVFFLVIYSASIVIAKKDYDKSAELNLKIFSDNISAALKHAQDVSVIFNDNETVKNYITGDMPSGEEKLALSDYLSGTISVMPNANGTVGITNMTSDHIVTKGSTMSFDFYCQSIGLSIDSAKGIAARLEKNKSENVAAVTSSKKGENYLMVTSKNSAWMERRTIFLADCLKSAGNTGGIHEHFGAI